jgi:hypothetical protein
MLTLPTGWRLQREDGGFVWISPTGHRYPIEPAQVGTILTAISNGRYISTPDEPPADEPDPEPEPGPDLDLDLDDFDLHEVDLLDVDQFDVDEFDPDELADADAEAEPTYA